MILEKLNQLRELVSLSLESHDVRLICDKLHHLILIYVKLQDVILQTNYIKKSHHISFLGKFPMLVVE